MRFRLLCSPLSRSLPGKMRPIAGTWQNQKTLCPLFGEWLTVLFIKGGRLPLPGCRLFEHSGVRKRGGGSGNGKEGREVVVFLVSSRSTWIIERTPRRREPLAEGPADDGQLPGCSETTREPPLWTFSMAIDKDKKGGHKRPFSICSRQSRFRFNPSLVCSNNSENDVEKRAAGCLNLEW